MDDHHDGSGQHRVHGHFDVCCPSLLMPVLATGAIDERPSDRLVILPAHPTQGAFPDRLLRPPIS
jgi:hypothetical protein